jgi:hypothetical protein
MPNNGYGYSYMPEMQGLTDIQQQDFSDQMAQQRGMFTGQAGRSGQQSGGSYFENLSRMGSQEARGLSNIERENQLKNAMMSREDRQRREQMDFQKSMAEDAYRRQLQMYRMQFSDQQNAQEQQALMGGLGSLASMVASPFISMGAKALGIGVSPYEKMFNGLSNEQIMSYMGMSMPEYGPGNMFPTKGR